MHVGGEADNVLKQLNVVRSGATTLRGMHAHSRYAEHYVPILGRMFFVLKDARQAEPSFGEELSFWVDGGNEIGLEVPAGVAHGVYFDEPGVLVYGLSSVWTGANEYGCRWNDPAIAALWPTQDPTLSERDSIAGSFDELVSALNADLRSIST
jgi:dTDP-4-dehydrorhamnose 3,5-epimerase